jgi:hypothetical protein
MTDPAAECKTAPSLLAGRLLHDRTADNLARVISRIPGASAQILTYDVQSRIARTLRLADGHGARRLSPMPGSDFSRVSR